MSCNINSINLAFDTEGKIKERIVRVAKDNNSKTIVLASYLKDDSFKSFLKKSLREEDIHKNETIDFNNFTESDYLKINLNRLGYLLNTYYLDHNFSVDNSKTDRQSGRLNGFSTGAAKTIAKGHTADLILQEYTVEIAKDPNNRRNNEAIIKAVNDKLLKEFYNNYVDLFVKDLENSKVNDDTKALIDEYNLLVGEIGNVMLSYNSNIENIRLLISKIEGLNNELKGLEKLYNKNKKDETIKSRIIAVGKEKEGYNKQIATYKATNKTLLNKKSNLDFDRYIVAQNLVNLHSESYDPIARTRLINFANLVSQTRGDTTAWYRQVFQNQKLTSIAKSFDNIEDIEQYLESFDENDDNINIVNNDDSVDGMAKSWEDALYKSVNHVINGKMRLILGSLRKRNSVYNPNSPNDGIDRDNALGTDNYLSYQYVTTQIFSFADKSTVDNFIKSIERKANSIKELYALGELVDRMKNDRVFANEVYTTFAMPHVYKSILEISQLSEEEGFDFNISNPNSLPEIELQFRMQNEIKSTYVDFTIEDLNRNTGVFSVGMKNAVTANPQEASLAVFNLLHKYFPSITKDTIDNFFKYNSNVEDNFARLRGSMLDLLNGIRAYKTAILQEELRVDEVNKGIRKSNQELIDTYKDKEIPEGTVIKIQELEKVDYSKYKLSNDTNRAIINIARILSNFTESKARLTSADATGSNGSDIVKNCYITRLFDQIQYGTEEDSNAGLKAFLQYLTQGTNPEFNQYANNPLLFGLKDENGIVIREGMFSKTESGYIVNQNAKEMLKLMLFNGIKNNQDNKSGTYSTMSKIDFLITQYKSFTHSMPFASETGMSTTVGYDEYDTGVYSMRIGSDAPKIYQIRAPKYSIGSVVGFPTSQKDKVDPSKLTLIPSKEDNSISYAFLGHVMDELYNMINSFNNVFEQEGSSWISKTNTFGLFDRAEYNGKVVDNGRFTGNDFKFKRLFDTRRYKAAEELEKMLLLYGDATSNALFIRLDDGRISLNTKRTDLIRYDEASGRIVPNISNENRAALLNVVNNWMSSFALDIIRDSSDYISILTENKVNFNYGDYLSFIINSANMNMNYDDLFEGDYSYYKNSRDFLKRTKESQAGGIGYVGGNTITNNDRLEELIDREQPIEIQVKTTATGAKGKYTVPTSKNGVISDAVMTARNGFRAVTIYNTVKASDYVGEMADEIRDILIKQGMDEDFATKRANTIARGFGFAGGDLSVVNDAQSYITIEEFIRRRWADGTLDEYQDLLGQLLDDNVPAEAINVDDINTRIQIQKNFYYDKVFDRTSGKYYPRQIKNAEFVLIPKLLPEGSQLRKVYDWMKANDIGQLNTAETSKAAKRNIFTIWDKTTGKFNENFEDEYTEDYVENYYYNYLYKQQDVAQHMLNAENKAGIQITKKIIDNTISNSNSDPELAKWSREFQDAYTTNIKHKFFEFLDAVDWAYDENEGRIYQKGYQNTQAYKDAMLIDNEANRKATIYKIKHTLSFDRFYARAREEATRLGMDSNFFDYITTDENGIPYMPNYMNSVSNKLESIAQSIYNGFITRQTLPGWHAAQITAVGYSKKLKFDAKTGVLEVYLPRWSRLIPKGKNQKENEEILKQIQEGGLDIHIGYRIPTEGKQSIAILRVVGFTHDALGSTIVVPDEWVTQTGSDFDVDSIYGISFEMYKTVDKKGRISLHKIEYEEDKVNDEDLYIRYVNKNIEDRIKYSDLGEEFKERFKAIRESLHIDEYKSKSKEFKKADEARNSLYASLPKRFQAISVRLSKMRQAAIEKQDKVNTLDEHYADIISRFDKELEKNTYTDEQVKVVNDYIEHLSDLISILQTLRGFGVYEKGTYTKEKEAAKKEIIDNAKAEYLEKIKEAAKNAGLMSFEEFSAQNHLDKLDVRARNNFIIDRMIKIMMHPSSREQQYSKSKFSDIIEANREIDALIENSKRTPSPYNPLDQLDYFNDVMGGARLKALSVVWDNFLSKNNIMQTSLSESYGVKVLLPYNEELYNKLRKRYGDDVQLVDDNERTSEEIQNFNKMLREKAINSPSFIYNDITWRDDEDNERESIRIVSPRTGKPFPTLYHALGYVKQYIYGKSENLHQWLDRSMSVDEAIKRTNAIEERAIPDKNLKDNSWNKIADSIEEDYIESYYEYNKIEEEDEIDKRTKEFTAEQLLKNIEDLDDNVARFTDKLDYTFTLYNIKFNKAIYDKNGVIAKKYPNIYNYITKNYPYSENAYVRGKYIVFNARKLGWSNDNRNMVDEYVTIYSSQTTSHHLDAVKEGSIPNVDEYTFNVYKMLSGLGLDFRHVISFIRQPAITRVVENNNIKNSIFFSNTYNPIATSLKKIAEEAGIYYNGKRVSIYSTDNDVATALISDIRFISAFNELYGIDVSTISPRELFNLTIPMKLDVLRNRIERSRGNYHIDSKNKGRWKDVAADVGTLIAFSQYYHTSQRINNIINTTNADKFGAKPSIRETRDVVSNISTYRQDDVLSKDGNTFLDLLYPVKEVVNEDSDSIFSEINYVIDLDNSLYPPIAAILKYATINSLRSSEELFKLESPTMAMAVDNIENVLAKHFTDEEYKELKRYMMAYAYGMTERIFSPLTLDKAGNIIIDTSKTKGKYQKEYIGDERIRVFGFGITSEGNISIKNINRPTNKEVEEFNKLTPLQKVIFIKKNFQDDAGIFSYIKTTSFTTGDIRKYGTTRQYLSYDDQVDSIEDLYQLFEAAFFNKNKLIKLAALDLIKYSFIAENFNFKNGYITKIITNSTLNTSRNVGGLDIVTDIDIQVDGLDRLTFTPEFIDNYVRSHSYSIKTTRLQSLPDTIYDNSGNKVFTKANTGTQFLFSKQADGLVYISLNNNSDEATKLARTLRLDRNAGGYIRVNYEENGRRQNVLYKVLGFNPINDKYSEFYLIPLNLLDSNEITDVSYNVNNNRFRPYEDFVEIIDEHRARIKENSSAATNRNYYKELIETEMAHKVKIQETYKPNPEFDVYNDASALMLAYDKTTDEKLKGGIKVLLKDIQDLYITTLAQNQPTMTYIPNASLQAMFKYAERAHQVLTLPNGNEVHVDIEKRSIYRKDVNDWFAKYRMGKSIASNKETVFVVYPHRDNTTTNRDIMNATTDFVDIEDAMNQSPRRVYDIDRTSSSIITEITYNARKNNNSVAKQFLRDMTINKVSTHLRSSLTQNRQNVYYSAARYYNSVASKLINKLNSFELAGRVYSMDDPELYKDLALHPEYYNDVAYTLLDAITFGNRIQDIMFLDLTAEDEVTKNAVLSIRDSIKRVRNNSKLYDAMNNMMNVYFKHYSTNPDVINDFIKIKDQFGDVGWFNKMFGDPADIDNNEVQVVLKQVYTMFHKAEMFTARQNVDEWKRQLKEIEDMPGELNFDKVIDNEKGRVRDEFNEKFLEDQTKLIETVNKARQEHGINSWQYFRAKLARDIFQANYKEQPIIAEYYKEEIAARVKVMDEAPIFYQAYMTLIHQFYDDTLELTETREQTRARKKRINSQLAMMLANVDEEGYNRSDDDLRQIEALKEYIDTKKKLNEKYFSFTEYDGFHEQYVQYKRIVDRYDATHSTLTLGEKLQNDEYAMAYNWITSNGRYGFKEETKKKIAQAFMDISGTKDGVSTQTKIDIKNKEGAYDDFGIINGNAFNDDEIRIFREREQEAFMTGYENHNGDGILIKDAPNRPIATNAFYEQNGEFTYENDELKNQLIIKINAILRKAVDRNDGHISSELMFNDNYVSRREREELASLYAQLRALKQFRWEEKKRQLEADGNMSYNNEEKPYELNINRDAYIREYNYFKTNLENTSDAKLWRMIFQNRDSRNLDAAIDALTRSGSYTAEELRELSEYYIPNEDMYGYYVPAPEFIDTRRTEARNFIQDNLEFVPTKYYYQALDKAIVENRYTEWYNANHVFNPYTKRMQPLRIWTTMQPKEGSSIANDYIYNPSFENMERSVKDEYINPNYNEFSSNYKRGDGRYDTNIKLNDKEKAFRKLLVETLNKYATTYQGRQFVNKGFLPRERVTEHDTEWYTKNIMALFGISYNMSGASDKFHDEIDYSHDRDAEFKMLELIKGKGSQEYEKIPTRGNMTEEEYENKVKEVRERNRKIHENNLAIDNKMLNRNWKEVMEDFVYNASIFNSKQAAKPYLYLLLEDIKNNKAYELKGIWNKNLVRDYAVSATDDEMYKKKDQKDTYELIQNLTRRLLFSEYHEPSKVRNIANFLQNLTSAKYMIFNVYGGFANVGVGKVNILVEQFAGEYFTTKELFTAEKQYLANIPAYLACAYQDEGINFTSGLIKFFNVVDFDQILQYGAGAESLDEKLKRIRDFTYTLQSSGEHYMQNTAMLAMLKSNRVYTDENGTKRLGDFKDFTQGVEIEAMRKVLSATPQLLAMYESFRSNIKYNPKQQLDITTGRKDVNRMFLNSIKISDRRNNSDNFAKISRKYAETRKQLLEEKKKLFYDDNVTPTVESQLEFKNGRINIKQGSPLTEDMVAFLKEKIIKVNQKIHGIYDKNGAAFIEKNFWGSLVMQYHKHLYVGIMKRWRRKGYYSEFRGSRERGAYQTLIDFLGTEFINYDDVRAGNEVDQDNVIMASIQNIIRGTIDTVLNWQLNWNNLSEAERANVRRMLGDLSGMLSAVLLVMGMYAIWDDDDIKEDTFKASLLYLADRLYTDSTMYTSAGLISEWKTAYSSPVAAVNGPSDLLKAITLIPQALFDPNYNPTYTTGQYRGQNKLEVLLRRNIPGVRPLDRIKFITKNNKYYKIDNSHIGINIAKTLGQYWNN